MVMVGGNRSPVEESGPDDVETVHSRLDTAIECPQHLHHGLDPVGLLGPQLSRITYRCDAFGVGADDGNEGQFVERCGDEVT